MKRIIILCLVFSTQLAFSTDKKETVNWQKATFAGGLFWFLDRAFDHTWGVKSSTTGYINGSKTKPYFDQVSAGKVSHLMGVQIIYDPDKVNYEKLLKKFWRNINPQDGKGQFLDRGKNFTTAIIFHNKKQEQLAKKSLKDLVESKRFKKEIKTKIVKYINFFEAEERHQDTYLLIKAHYNRYKISSGRDTFIKSYWPEEAVEKHESIFGFGN